MTENVPVDANSEMEQLTFKDLPPEQRGQVLEASIDESVKEFIGVLEEKEPRWPRLAVFQILYHALTNLRHYVNEKTDNAISWASPWVEVQYPVHYDFQRRMPVPEPLTESELAGESHVIAFGHRGFEELKRRLFTVLTNQVALAREGGILEYMLPEDLAEELKALSPEDKEREVRKRAEPFTVGGVANGPSRVRVTIPGSDGQEAEFPAVQVGIETDDDRRFLASVVFQIKPLLVDFDRKLAYFPLVVGLIFYSDNAQVVPSPELSDQEQEAFWQELLGTIDRFLVEESQFLLPETEEQEARLQLEEKVKVTRPTIGVPFGSTVASAKAMEIIQLSHRINFPTRLESVPLWENLVEEEIKRLRGLGDEAFKDYRPSGGRGPLLKKLYKSTGENEVQLTEEAKRELKKRSGLHKGYIGPDHAGRECFIRIFDVGPRGFLEIGLSWAGMAKPFIADWVLDYRKRAEEEQRQFKEPLLFGHLDPQHRHAVDMMLLRSRIWAHGHAMMKAILGMVFRQCRNPVEIPSEAFQLLLWPDKDYPGDWKQQVECALSALREISFSVRTFQTGESIKGEGSFIGQWVYRGLGQGKHTDGVYTISVQDGFLGCLQVFEGEKTRLRSGGEARQLIFNKQLSKEQKDKLGWGKGRGSTDSYIQFDAGRPWFDRAAGLTAEQTNLLDFIERNLTCKRDGVRKGRGEVRAHRRASDGYQHRIYDSAFCPRLPKDHSFFAALGHFHANPEMGFTLLGSERRGKKPAEGIMTAMGHFPPPNTSSPKRKEMIVQALKDLKAVVVEYLDGVVVGHLNGEWIGFDQFTDLDEQSLTRKLRVFCFLPHDYEKRRGEKWEKKTGKKITHSAQEAEMDAWRQRPMIEDPRSPEQRPFGASTTHQGRSELRNSPLNVRLHAKMKERGLNGKELARIFGVSPMGISYWLRGTEPDADGKVKGRAVPEEMVPIVLRWIDTGQAPSSEELAARKTKRPGVRKELTGETGNGVFPS